MIRIHRPTSLRIWSDNCPRALDYYEKGVPYFRDDFSAGIAAHAFLENLGAATAKLGQTLPDEHVAAIVEEVTKTLITDGRSHAGHQEPPLRPEPVWEGRKIAVDWLEFNTLSDTAKYEIGIGFDREWGAVGYTDPNARIRMIYDVLDVAEHYDEETAGSGVVARDYKTAWPTNDSWFTSIQGKAQAVGAWLHGAQALGVEGVDFIRQEAVNLRTREVFRNDIWLDEDGIAMLEEWKSDLDAVMSAADTQGQAGQRPARPGKGCLRCAYITSCQPAKDMLGAINIPADPVQIAKTFVAADATRIRWIGLAKEAAPEDGIRINENTVVGTIAKESGTPADDAWEQLLAAWEKDGGEHRGFIRAANLGVTQIKTLAKALHPGRSNKSLREELIDSLLVTKLQRRFGIHNID